MTYSVTIAKILSRNDVGATGAHQAGLLVNKKAEILGFFPRLNAGEKNPRKTMRFTDSGGSHWDFEFIYYNNKFFGGTRNEYRLTCMTPFFKAHNAQPGDAIILSKTGQGGFRIEIERAGGSSMIKLTGQWVLVPMRSR